MIKVEVKAEVTYTCFLSKEDSDKVKKYAEENECELIEAVEELYINNPLDESIELYKDSVESDFSTEEFVFAEEE